MRKGNGKMAQRQRDGQKYTRLIRAGRVPDRRITIAMGGECAHVRFGKCKACQTGRRPYQTETLGVLAATRFR